MKIGLGTYLFKCTKTNENGNITNQSSSEREVNSYKQPTLKMKKGWEGGNYSSSGGRGRRSVV
jgi:hypothetical protein